MMKVLRWFPDCCPIFPGCRFRVIDKVDMNTLFMTEHLCSLHVQLREQGLEDVDVYNRVVELNRYREGQRWAAKQILGLPKKHGGVDYRMERDGKFTLGVSSKGKAMPEFPKEGTRLHEKLMADIRRKS